MRPALLAISAYISAELFPHWVPYDAATEEDRQKQAKALVHRAARKLRKAGSSTMRRTGMPI